MKSDIWSLGITMVTYDTHPEHGVSGHAAEMGHWDQKADTLTAGLGTLSCLRLQELLRDSDLQCGIVEIAGWMGNPSLSLYSTMN